ncbi:chlorohydrolase [Streptococcus pneumoniae]|nr:chlorohydrolase [Streptococcus pneumoniae]
MKIKEQTRKLAAGCSKHCFEVADRTDEVSSKHGFEVADRTDEVSSKHCFEVADRTDEVSSKHGFEVVDETDEVSNQTYGRATKRGLKRFSKSINYYALQTSVEVIYYR